MKVLLLFSVVLLLHFSFVFGHENCTCTIDNCDCCRKLEIKHVIDKELCLNVTLDESTEAITVQVLISGKNVVKFSFNEDKEECFSYEIIDFCLVLDNFHSTKNGTCGCFGVEAKVFGMKLGPFDLGCFTMGHDCDPHKESNMLLKKFQSAMQKDIQHPSKKTPPSLRMKK